MRYCISRSVVCAVLATLVWLAQGENLSPAAPSPLPAGAKPSPGADKKITRYPIHGKLKSVDLLARTFTLQGAQKDRIFKVNARTVVTKFGRHASLSDGKPGEEVGGFVEKGADGSQTALSVRFGPKPEGSGAAAKSARPKPGQRNQNERQSLPP